MSKGIVFTDSQIKAFENGATMFIVPITLKGYSFSNIEKDGIRFKNNKNILDTIVIQAPIQKGEEFFIQYDTEEVFSRGMSPWGIEIKSRVIRPASQMQEHQSRFKNIKCIDVRAVRVGELLMGDINKLGMEDEFVNDNFPYPNNDHIFLIEIKNER